MSPVATAPKKSEFASKLAKLKAGWKKSIEEAQKAPTFSNLPGGRYKAQITDGGVGESKASGRLQAWFEHTVLEGEQQGETQRKFWGLDKPENLQWLHRDIMRLGYEPPEDPEELEGFFAEVVKVKPILRIQVKEDGEYVNIYYEKILSAEAGEAETAGEQAASEAAGEPAPEAASNGVQTELTEVAPEATAEEQGTEIAPGLRVFITSAGENATVKAVDESADKPVTVKTDSGKLLEVGVDDMEPEKELPKKPAPTPAKAGLRVLKK